MIGTDPLLQALGSMRVTLVGADRSLLQHVCGRRSGRRVEHQRLCDGGRDRVTSRFGVRQPAGRRDALSLHLELGQVLALVARLVQDAGVELETNDGKDHDGKQDEQGDL